MSVSSAKYKVAVMLTQTPTPEEGAIWMFVLSQVRRPQEAAAAYTRAWELASRLPENAIAAGPALRGLAVACVDLGDLERAEKLLRDSLVINPGNPVATRELDYIPQRRLEVTRSQPGSSAE